MKDKKYKNKNYLKEKYVKQDKSSPEIAEECGVSSPTIRNWLDKYDINKVRNYRNKQWLKEKYIQEGMTMEEIAKEENVTRHAISHWIHEFNLNKNETVCCPSCDREFYHLGNHWNSSRDCEPEITKRQENIFTGLLMGDGTLASRDNTPYIQCGMINEEYLKYIDNIVGVLGTGVRLSKTAKESYNQSKNSTFFKDYNAKLSNYNDVFVFKTRSHSGLGKFLQWYETGKKILPSNILLNPTILKHWYVCDGTLETIPTKNGKRYKVSISVCSERKNKEKINKYFSRVNLPKPCYWNETERNNDAVKSSIVWNKKETKEMLEYMGKPLPGFEYKWPEEIRSGKRQQKKDLSTDGSNPWS